MKNNIKLIILFSILYSCITIITGIKRCKSQEYIINDPNVTFAWDYDNPPLDMKEFTLLESKDKVNFEDIKNISYNFSTTKYKIPNENIFYYTIIAVDNANNRSGYSNIIKIIYDKTPPHNIQNFRKDGNEKIVINNTINLTFNDQKEKLINN